MRDARRARLGAWPALFSFPEKNPTNVGRIESCRPGRGQGACEELRSWRLVWMSM